MARINYYPECAESRGRSALWQYGGRARCGFVANAENIRSSAKQAKSFVYWMDAYEFAYWNKGGIVGIATRRVEVRVPTETVIMQ